MWEEEEVGQVGLCYADCETAVDKTNKKTRTEREVREDGVE